MHLHMHAHTHTLTHAQARTAVPDMFVACCMLVLFLNEFPAKMSDPQLVSAWCTASWGSARSRALDDHAHSLTAQHVFKHRVSCVHAVLLYMFHFTHTDVYMLELNHMTYARSYTSACIYMSTHTNHDPTMLLWMLLVLYSRYGETIRIARRNHPDQQRSRAPWDWCAGSLLWCSVGGIQHSKCIVSCAAQSEVCFNTGEVTNNIVRPQASKYIKQNNWSTSNNK